MTDSRDGEPGSSADVAGARRTSRLQRARDPASARPKSRTPLGCGARTFCVWLSVSGALLLVDSWRDGDAATVVVGLIPLALSSLITVSTLPVEGALRRRMPVARRAAAAGWTGRRVAAALLCVILVLVAPGPCVAGVSRGDGVLFATSFAMFVAAYLLWRIAGVHDPVRWHALRRKSIARAQRPDEAWTWDYPWDPQGESRSFSGYHNTRTMYLLRVSLFVSLLMLPVPASGDSAYVVVPLRIALGVAGSVWLVRTWRVFGMGRVSVGFLRFPVHPGERAAFTLGVSEGGAEVQNVAVVLRHYRESRDETGPGGGLPLCTAEVAPAVALPVPVLTPGVDQKVEFDIPEAAPVTSISSAHPCYWELEVRGRTREGAYEDRFLVPVYAKPETPGIAG